MEGNKAIALRLWCLWLNMPSLCRWLRSTAFTSRISWI